MTVIQWVTSKNVIVSCTCALGQHNAKRRRKCTKHHVLACNFAKFSPISIFFTHRLSNKPFLIWLYIRCGGVVNNQINTVCQWKKIKIGEYVTIHGCPMYFVRLANWLLKDEESARYNPMPNIHRFKNIFSFRLSSKPFLIWLLTTPPYLKYVAILPCNLSLIACFLTLMCHKVVLQHMQSTVGFLAMTLLKIY